MQHEQATVNATLSLVSSLISELREAQLLKNDSIEAIFDSAIKDCLVQENTDGADLLRKLRR